MTTKTKIEEIEMTKPLKVSVSLLMEKLSRTLGYTPKKVIINNGVISIKK